MSSLLSSFFFLKKKMLCFLLWQLNFSKINTIYIQARPFPAPLLSQHLCVRHCNYYFLSDTLVTRVALSWVPAGAPGSSAGFYAGKRCWLWVMSKEKIGEGMLLPSASCILPSEDFCLQFSPLALGSLSRDVIDIVTENNGIYSPGSTL